MVVHEKLGEKGRGDENSDRGGQFSSRKMSGVFSVGLGWEQRALLDWERVVLGFQSSDHFDYEWDSKTEA